MTQSSFTHERQPRSFRAILIDPFARRVTEGFQLPGLTAVYASLSGPGFPIDDTFPTDPGQWGDMPREDVPVSCIDIRSVGRDHTGQSVDLICDDEGRLRGHMACFQLGGTDGALIAGRALLVGSDNEGETCGTALPLFEAVRRIAWCAWDHDYTPPPPIVTALRPGETFAEAIARAQRGED